MLSYEERLQKCYEVYAKDMNCSIQEVKQFLIDEWGVFAPRGYEVFVSPETDALHIQRIDEMDVFNGDIEAAEQAEKDGVKLIPVSKIKNKEPYKFMRFIDTVENREILRKENAFKE